MEQEGGTLQISINQYGLEVCAAPICMEQEGGAVQRLPEDCSPLPDNLGVRGLQRLLLQELF
jgi:hypothetical protein